MLSFIDQSFIYKSFIKQTFMEELILEKSVLYEFVKPFFKLGVFHMECLFACSHSLRVFLA